MQLVVEGDARAELGALRLHVLLLDEADGAAAVDAGGRPLRLALAGLVVDRWPSGWLTRRNSITPARASFTAGVPVRMWRPGVALVKQAIWSSGHPVDVARRWRIHDRLLGGGSTGGSAHLDQTHVAVARDGEL